MPLYLALTCVSALLAVSVYAIVDRRNHDVSRKRLPPLHRPLRRHLPRGGHAEGRHVVSTALPLGLPWIGMHFRIDVLTAFFLAVVNLGGAAASAYAIGYGAHEKEPMRVLPFYPAFLAGMNLVVLADDAFTFLVAWEFMSLTSWALVLDASS